MDPRPEEPIVFLDVDGPLVPFGGQDLPAGSDEDPNGNPLLHRVDPALGAPLLALPAHLVWATTWGDEANEVLSPALGLPRLPVVSWPEDEPAVPRGVHWKTSTLVQWAAGRPFVWIDDEVGDADREWVELQQPRRALLYRVDARLGLTVTDLEAVREWVTRMS